MPTYRFSVNGTPATVDADADMPVLWALRDLLGLTGTKYGCGIGQCGSCTVHIDGEAYRSCTLAISDCEGRSITTIEGLAAQHDHPIQRAWTDRDVPQCGYCQPGIIMTAAAAMAKGATTAEVTEAAAGHLCRCGTYNRIAAGIADAVGGDSR
jgi:isoquinoline 1-oxidoreductase alpha subunit